MRSASLTIVGRASFGFFIAALLAAGACSNGSGDEDRPPGISGTFGEGPPMPECQPPPQPDTTDVCSEETVPLFGRKPTLYFVLDVSGSMLDTIPEGSDTKLDAAKTALADVVREVGHLSNYGLTVFPGEDTPDSSFPANCAAGDEIFEVTEGDPLECVNLPPSGPVFNSFVRKLARAQAGGGTPLAPTMASVSRTLAERSDQTAIIVITDGSPNCNDEASCDADLCEPSRNNWTLRDENGEALVCDEETNCCDESVIGEEDAHLACVDRDNSVAEIEALRQAGIFTYVIGVLGDSDFDDVMNDLAEAGGKARSGSRKYFDVESLAELVQTVRSIGLDLALTCDIELVEPPTFPDQFNVYFDGTLVPSDEDNGWTLEEGVVTLHGDACEQMQSGEVSEVQLLAGCTTIVR